MFPLKTKTPLRFLSQVFGLCLLCVTGLNFKLSMCRCLCYTILLIILRLSTVWSGSKVQTTLVIISFSCSIKVHDNNRNTVSLGFIIIIIIIGDLVQWTLVISKSNGLYETLRSIRTATYQIFGLRKTFNRTTTFNRMNNVI